jgi:hypothetical protein
MYVVARNSLMKGRLVRYQIKLLPYPCVHANYSLVFCIVLCIMFQCQTFSK